MGRQHNLWRVVPRATVALSCCQLVLVINETPSRAWLSWQRNASLRPTFQLLTWAIYLAITRLPFECKLVWQKVWSVKNMTNKTLRGEKHPGSSLQLLVRLFWVAGRVHDIHYRTSCIRRWKVAHYWRLITVYALSEMKHHENFWTLTPSRLNLNSNI